MKTKMDSAMLPDSVRRRLKFEQAHQAAAARVAELVPIVMREAEANSDLKAAAKILEVRRLLSVKSVTSAVSSN